MQPLRTTKIYAHYLQALSHKYIVTGGEDHYHLDHYNNGTLLYIIQQYTKTDSFAYIPVLCYLFIKIIPEMYTIQYTHYSTSIHY